MAFLLLFQIAGRTAKAGPGVVWFLAGSLLAQHFMADRSVQRMVKLVNPQGFHARPAHMFMKLASQYSASVEILKGNEIINGKSILDLLTLGAVNGTTLCLRAIGDDAQAAVDALSELIESGFGEMPGQAPS